MKHGQGLRTKYNSHVCTHCNRRTSASHGRSGSIARSPPGFPPNENLDLTPAVCSGHSLARPKFAGAETPTFPWPITALASTSQPTKPSLAGLDAGKRPRTSSVVLRGYVHRQTTPSVGFNPVAWPGSCDWIWEASSCVSHRRLFGGLFWLLVQ